MLLIVMSVQKNNLSCGFTLQPVITYPSWFIVKIL